jgi:hypothetical protein
MHRVLGLPAGLLRASVWALLLTLSAAAFGPALHGAHEEDCVRPFVAHDASQHHVKSAPEARSTMPGDHHCVACHFARASRGQVAWEGSRLSVLADGVLLYHTDGQLIAAPSAQPLPARAPPRV